LFAGVTLRTAAGKQRGTEQKGDAEFSSRSGRAGRHGECWRAGVIQEASPCVKGRYIEAIIRQEY
jgi:hypothetical protein